MEKKIWSAPEIGAVQFQANEYVAACGDTFTTSGYLVIESGLDTDTMNHGGRNTAFDYADSWGFDRGGRNTAGYLSGVHDYISGKSYDASLLFEVVDPTQQSGTRGSREWQDSTGHTHTFDKDNSYLGWYAPVNENEDASLGVYDTLYATQSLWTKAWIWFQDISNGANSMNNIHAISAHSI